jgi:hypothetical protein
MKNITILLFFLISSFIISCSSDNSENIPIDFSNIVVEKSPWILDRVEISQIEGKGGYVFNPSEIQEIATLLKNNYYCTLSFNADGTGIWNSEGYCQDCTITWEEVIGESSIRWSHRVIIYYYHISHSNQNTELIWNTKSEDGFAIKRPDGTLIRGDYLECNYIYK